LPALCRTISARKCPAISSNPSIYRHRARHKTRGSALLERDNSPCGHLAIDRHIFPGCQWPRQGPSFPRISDICARSLRGRPVPSSIVIGCRPSPIRCRIRSRRRFSLHPAEDFWKFLSAPSNFGPEPPEKQDWIPEGRHHGPGVELIQPAQIHSGPWLPQGAVYIACTCWAMIVVMYIRSYPIAQQDTEKGHSANCGQPRQSPICLAKLPCLQKAHLTFFQNRLSAGVENHGSKFE